MPIKLRLTASIINTTMARKTLDLLGIAFDVKLLTEAPLEGGTSPEISRAGKARSYALL
jgi:hypothetical protein